MIINTEQLEALHSTFVTQGLDISEFEELHSDEIYFIRHRIEASIYFDIRPSITGALIGDVFCDPYTYQKTMYKPCYHFNECLDIAKEWSTVACYKLLRKPYYHKIFISHSSKDKVILDAFVEMILIDSCSISTSNIVYTSKESTGVELGEGIPTFIQDNLKTSSLVLFMISDNYRHSEVCLNEMGAAWVLDKKSISVLLPNCNFNSLGWLTSLNKAMKIDNEESLDILYDMLARTKKNKTDWEERKNTFLELCKSYIITITK